MPFAQRRKLAGTCRHTVEMLPPSAWITSIRAASSARSTPSRQGLCDFREAALHGAPLHRHRNASMKVLQRGLTTRALAFVPSVRPGPLRRGRWAAVQGARAMATQAPWQPQLEASLQRNSEARNAFYYQLATVGKDCMPSNRTVVHRGFLPDSRLCFVTDARWAWPLMRRGEEGHWPCPTRRAACLCRAGQATTRSAAAASSVEVWLRDRTSSPGWHGTSPAQHDGRPA